MNRPARTLPDEPEASADPLAEAYAREEEYTEWHGPDKPNRPGVHVVAYAAAGTAAVLVVTVWILGRLVVQYVAG